MTLRTFIGDSSTGLVGAINGIVVPFIFTLAFLVFIWGVFNYFFRNVDNEKARLQGREFILYGVLGMALLFTVWGIVRILLSTLGILP